MIRQMCNTCNKLTGETEKTWSKAWHCSTFIEHHQQMLNNVSLCITSLKSHPLDHEILRYPLPPPPGPTLMEESGSDDIAYPRLILQSATQTKHIYIQYGKWKYFCTFILTQPGILRTKKTLVSSVLRDTPRTRIPNNLLPVSSQVHVNVPTAINTNRLKCA